MEEPHLISSMWHWWLGGTFPWRNLKEGFEVVVADGYNMTCTQRIIRLNVTLRNYMLINDFYVVDLVDNKYGVGSTMVIFPWRFQNELSDYEDGIHRPRGS